MARRVQCPGWGLGPQVAVPGPWANLANAGVMRKRTVLTNDEAACTHVAKLVLDLTSKSLSQDSHHHQQLRHKPTSTIIPSAIDE